MRVFLASTTNGKRRLHPACVISVDGTCMVHSVDPKLDIDAGSEMLLFFEHQREFMQQAARVDALLDERSFDYLDSEDDDATFIDPATQQQLDAMMELDSEAFDDPFPQTIAIQLIGDPVSAESRQCFRVSTVMSGRTAALDDESDCDLLDVSVTGFAVKANTRHNVGDHVVSVHEHEGRRYSGKTCVQSATPMRDGSCRYGLHCMNEDESRAMTEALQQISMAVQREHLRRRARAS